MAELTITNHTLSFASQIFQIRNITQIRIDPWRRPPRIGFGSMVILFLGGGLLCFVDPPFMQKLWNGIFSTHVHNPPGLYFMAGVGALALFGYGCWDRTKLDFYTLYLETNSGSTKLFSSRDYKSIKKIAVAIHSVMENRNTPVSYHVSIDQSKITLGDEFSHIGEGATITNRSSVGR